MKTKKWFKTIISVSKIVFTTNSSWMAGYCGAMLISACCSAFQVSIMNDSIDGLMSLISEKAAIMNLMKPVLLLITYFIANEVIFSLAGFLSIPAGIMLENKLYSLIHDKTKRLNLVCFEKRESLELIEKAKLSAESAINYFYASASILFFSLPYFVITSIILYKARPLLLVAIFLVFLPQAFAQIGRKRIASQTIDDFVPYLRREQYLKKEITEQAYLKENRLLGIVPKFRNMYKENLYSHCMLEWESKKAACTIQILVKIITVIGYLIVFYISIDSLLSNYITVGTFAGIFSAIYRMLDFSEEFVRESIGGLFESYGTMEKFIAFLDLKEDSGEDVTIDYDKDIEVREISFSYPEQGKKALDSVSLTIHPNETIALVGKNGSGKTTLARVILGLLHPTSGNVKVGKVNLHDTCPSKRYQLSSAMFQNYFCYKISLKGNIVISSERTSEDEEYQKVKEIIDIDCLDEQILSKDFGGIELSGGNKQRVAMGRAIFKESRFIVLDEPTAAIDPLEENILYSRIREIVEGKTAVIVTHRLGLAKIADRIVVMDEGRIVEHGTHEELYSQMGEYYRLYNSQAKWYFN